MTFTLSANRKYEEQFLSVVSRHTTHNHAINELSSELVRDVWHLNVDDWQRLDKVVCVVACFVQVVKLVT